VSWLIWIWIGGIAVLALALLWAIVHFALSKRH
jgi:hypothetical protein